MIRDSVLHAYLSKIADTAEKRHYLHVSETAVHAIYCGFRHNFDPFSRTLLGDLYELKVFNLKPSDFQPYDLCILLVIMDRESVLSDYIKGFRSDPQRSREFHYEPGVWITFVVTRYMSYLRTLSSTR